MRYVRSDYYDFKKKFPRIYGAEFTEYEPDGKKSYHRVQVKYDDPDKFLKKLYIKELRPNDFDNCGTETIIFQFDNGEFWKIEHSWWAEYDEEGRNHFYEHYIEKLDKNDKEIPDHIKINLTRDWL